MGSITVAINLYMIWENQFHLGNCTMYVQNMGVVKGGGLNPPSLLFYDNNLHCLIIIFNDCVL